MITLEPQKYKRYTLSVGMCDKDTHCQVHDTQQIINLIHNCCKIYGCAYSTALSNGGYQHYNGYYVEEQSMIVTLIDPDEATVNELAKDLCAFLHQETVMICIDEVSSYFISEEV